MDEAAFLRGRLDQRGSFSLVIERRDISICVSHVGGEAGGDDRKVNE